MRYSFSFLAAKEVLRIRRKCCRPRAQGDGHGVAPPRHDWPPAARVRPIEGGRGGAAQGVGVEVVGATHEGMPPPLARLRPKRSTRTLYPPGPGRSSERSRRGGAARPVMPRCRGLKWPRVLLALELGIAWTLSPYMGPGFCMLPLSGLTRLTMEKAGAPTPGPSPTRRPSCVTRGVYIFGSGRPTLTERARCGDSGESCVPVFGGTLGLRCDGFRS